MVSRVQRNCVLWSEDARRQSSDRQLLYFSSIDVHRGDRTGIDMIHARERLKQVQRAFLHHLDCVFYILLYVYVYKKYVVFRAWCIAYIHLGA